MKRKEKEGYLLYAQRCTQALEDGEIGVDEWAVSLLGEEGSVYSSEYLRRASVIMRRFFEKMTKEGIGCNDYDVLEAIKQAKEELQVEKIKIQTANLEHNANIRAEAREDMFREQIVEAIKRLEPIEVKQDNFLNLSKVGTTALIATSDYHAGSTFEVNGMYGEVVNKYDYNIMTARMWELLHKIEADDIVYDDIVFAILGDCFENILRMSSLSKLQEPVVDTVIKFSEFMAQWIAEAKRRLGVPIRVVTIGGNHDCARLLTSKPQFEGENLTKLVVEFLKLRLDGIDDIIVDEYTDVAVVNIRGTSVMFQHGEDKDIQRTMDYFQNLYNIDVDEIYCGHLHRQENKTVGITECGDREITRVGSIVGTDTYAKKIRVCARPSAYVALYTDEGKGWNKKYYL